MLHKMGLRIGVTALWLSMIVGCAAGGSTPGGSAISPPAGLDAATQTKSAGNAADRAVFPKSWMAPAVAQGKNLVYVSDSNAVEIYPAGKNNPAPIGSITEGIMGPDGISVATNGDLYVANAGSTTVTVYHAGQTKPYFTYSPGNNPRAVVVGPDGMVYIAQGYVQGGGGGCDCISEYMRGSSIPTRTIPLSSTGGSPMAMTFDHLGNLYVSLSADGFGTFTAVYEFAPGQTTGSNIGLLGLHHSRGLAFDRQKALVVADDPLSFTNGYVDIFPSGKTQYWKRIAVGGQPFEIAFGHGKSQLYVANVGYGYYDGYIGILDARDKFKQIGTISQGLLLPIGVALSPDAI